jgi:hypothetical protein
MDGYPLSSGQPENARESGKGHLSDNNPPPSQRLHLTSAAINGFLVVFSMTLFPRSRIVNVPRLPGLA